MTPLTATKARKQIYGLFNAVAASHEPVQIAGKRNSAVLIAADDWRAAIQETLGVVQNREPTCKSARKTGES